MYRLRQEVFLVLRGGCRYRQGFRSLESFSSAVLEDAQGVDGRLFACREIFELEFLERPGQGLMGSRHT